MGKVVYDPAHLAAAAQRVERVATPLQSRHGKCRFSLREKAAFSPKALPLRKRKGSKSLGADGQTRKRICVQIRSGIARRRGGKSYERFSAPAGLASQSESRLPSFSSTPAAVPAGAFRSATERSEALSAEMRSSFSRQEKKKRGLQKSIPRAQRGKMFPPTQWAKRTPGCNPGNIPTAW